MATTYKQKLIGEINSLPEELIPHFYRIVRTLRSELTNRTAVTPKRGSLGGIWRLMNHISLRQKNLSSPTKARLEMHDKLIVATAIRYDACLITRDEQITKSKTVKTIW